MYNLYYLKTLFMFNFFSYFSALVPSAFVPPRLYLSFSLVLREAKCGFCCWSKCRFVMEMFFVYPPHINLAHLICSLPLTMSTRSFDRARPQRAEGKRRFCAVLNFLRNKNEQYRRKVQVISKAQCFGNYRNYT